MLTARALAVVRGGRTVLDSVGFDLAPGGALLLAGPNGAGKSTLLRVLAGLVPPAAGAIAWDGADALTDPPLHARRLVLVGHLDAIKPGLSVAENLAFAARLRGGTPGAALDAVGLAALADLPARDLSAGQRRRLALARLALAPAPLWLLDEPTLGLDARAVERLGAMLAAHRAAGGMVVAATHLPLPLPDAATLRL